MPTNNAADFTTAASTAASSSSSSSAVLPTSEDYRALLLDLLLYRRETLEPVLVALRKEREELEVKLAELEAHVRELREIRDNLRRFAEQQADEEARKLHRVIGTSAASARESKDGDVTPHGATTDDDEIVL